MGKQFTVRVCYDNGEHKNVRRFVSAQEAGRAFQHYTTTPCAPRWNAKLRLSRSCMTASFEILDNTRLTRVRRTSSSNRARVAALVADAAADWRYV